MCVYLHKSCSISSWITHVQSDLLYTGLLQDINFSYNQVHGAEFFLRNNNFSPSQKIPAVMKPENPLTYSKQFTASRHFEPDESSTHLPENFLRPILILSSNICLDLRNCPFHSEFSEQNSVCTSKLSHAYRMFCPSQLLDLMTLILGLFCEGYKLWSSFFIILLRLPS
jgi:hypothetical protein